MAESQQQREEMSCVTYESRDVGAHQIHQRAYCSPEPRVFCDGWYKSIKNVVIFWPLTVYTDVTGTEDFILCFQLDASNVKGTIRYTIGNFTSDLEDKDRSKSRISLFLLRARNDVL